MNNSALPTDRGRLIIILLGILFMLFSISHNGLNIRLGGDINLSDLGDHITVELTMDEPISLALPQPIQMVTTGPDGEAIPASLAFAHCPSCGGPMLPSKWNPWNGQIEWTCPVCDEAPALPKTP